jgi:hypothetical protein
VSHAPVLAKARPFAAGILAPGAGCGADENSGKTDEENPAEAGR